MNFRFVVNLIREIYQGFIRKSDTPNIFPRARKIAVLECGIVLYVVLGQTDVVHFLFPALMMSHGPR